MNAVLFLLRQPYQRLWLSRPLKKTKTKTDPNAIYALFSIKSDRRFSRADRLGLNSLLHL